MKKNIFLIISILLSITSYGQIKTKVTGYIPSLNEYTSDVELNVFYPLVIGKGRKIDYKTKTKKGNFEFELELSEPVQFGGKINEKVFLFPGTYAVLINPGDSIHIEIPNEKKLGILDLNFSGVGAEKINFQKKIVEKKISLYKTDPSYNSQSIEYRFKSADEKLNAIDSICRIYEKILAKNDINLIRANEYETVLDMLTHTAVKSTSDSVHSLFNEFIVKKNRVLPFLSGSNIYSNGLTVIRDYVLLLEYRNPITHGGGEIIQSDPILYCNLIIKHLSKYPIAMEYLLSSAAINVFTREQDSKNSRMIYQLYSETVNHDSPFYSKVRDNYQIVMSRLKKGMPFYPFSLPDTTGRTFTLSDFKGKVVILDFWFNGCGGCRVLAPVMEELEKDYQGKNIQFISVSIDSDKKWWLAGIGKYCSRNSLQLFTEGLETKHPLVKYLNPSGYPFLIAIDKMGNLIGPPPDPRTSRDEFKRFIAQFL